MKSTHRRNFLKLPLAAAAAQTISIAPFAAGAASRLDEYDPNNTKIATMVNARADDDHFLFLKQIGVQWVHVQFPLDTNFDLIKNTQDRLAHFGIKIHCAMVDHYRSQKIQLGKPGRDEDIEKFQTFLRDLGRLGRRRRWRVAPSAPSTSELVSAALKRTSTTCSTSSISARPTRRSR